MNANTYIIFVSLALVMLTVVGGIGSVAGALMGGILAGTAFQALTSTFTNLSTDHGGGGFWNVLANVSLVAPALIGISLGATRAAPSPRSWPAIARCGRSSGRPGARRGGRGLVSTSSSLQRHGQLVVRPGHRRSS